MKNIFYFLAITLFSCTSVSDTESMLFGKWEYEKITKNDTSLLEISQGDEMELSIDYLFNYHLDKANKHAQGSWKLFGDTLQFSYEPHQKTRNFIIEKVTDKILIFYENDVYFYYTRED